jgi:hypothetical protein
LRPDQEIFRHSNHFFGDREIYFQKGRVIHRFLMIGILLLQSGCLPMYILDKNEREEMQELNLKREQAGLKPVTWEEYHNHGMHP